MASDVLERWRDDPEYLAADGSPKRLPEEGPAPSVAALLKACVPKSQMASVLDYLRRCRSVLIDSEGGWSVLEEELKMAEDGQLVLRGHNMALGLLANLWGNWTKTGRKMFNTHARVFGLRKERRGELEGVARKSMMTGLVEVDRWMRSVEIAGPRAQPGDEVGIALFEYELPVRKRGAPRPRSAVTESPRKAARKGRLSPRTTSPRGRAP
jgi:hypothetical protein